MKEKIRVMIAAALPIVGIALIPPDARTEIAEKANGLWQAVSYQTKQYEEYCAKKLFLQKQYFAELSATRNKGASPLLLWHRFSLIPPPLLLRSISARNVYSKKQVNPVVNAALINGR